MSHKKAFLLSCHVNLNELYEFYTFSPFFSFYFFSLNLTRDLLMVSMVKR